MKWLAISCLALSCATAWSKTSSHFSGFVKIRKGHKLFVEHYPAAPNKPTIFLLNGLTYSTREFHPLIAAIRNLDKGIGIVAYDMVGMGQTLLADAPIRIDIPIKNQVRDLHDLRKSLNIEGRTIAAGLSYGGAVGLYAATEYPDDFDVYVAIAPFLERLETQDTLINNYVRFHRMSNPFDPRTDDELYDYYLRILVYSTYPIAEPIILENKYKIEAVYRMVKGAKNWNAYEKADQLPAGRVHVFGAVQDEYVKIDRLDEFWESLNGRGASYLRLNHSRHKIPEEWPRITAVWLLNIAKGLPALQDGLVFDGDPINRVAVNGDRTIPLDKEANCESLLRAPLKSITR